MDLSAPVCATPEYHHCGMTKVIITWQIKIKDTETGHVCVFASNTQCIK